MIKVYKSELQLKSGFEMGKGVFKRSEVKVSPDIRRLAMELIRGTTPIDPMNY